MPKPRAWLIHDERHPGAVGITTDPKEGEFWSRNNQSTPLYTDHQPDGGDTYQPMVILGLLSAIGGLFIGLFIGFSIGVLVI